MRLQRKHGGIDTSIPIPLHDRSFDLVLLSNWEDQIAYEPENEPPSVDPSRTDLMAPVNKALESGAWTQSIIWGPRAPFRDFTQIEFNNGDDIIPEERPPSPCHLFASLSFSNVLVAQEFRPRKRLRLDNAQVKDKFNLSNDQFYDVSKDGGRHRVRQTFGDLVVEHAYPAQKLQLPFVRHRLGWVIRSVLNAICLSSIRHVWGSRRRGLSIGQHYKFQRILRFASPKCAQPRRRKTGLGGGSVVGVTLQRI